MKDIPAFQTYTLVTCTARRDDVKCTLTTATPITPAHAEQFDAEVRQAVNAATAGERWMVARIIAPNGMKLGEVAA